MIPALENKNFRLWLAGFGLANIGMWMQRLAQDWLVLELTDQSGTALGLVTGLQFLPILILGPFAGVIADRFPKRRTLALAQSVSALCGLVLAALVLTDLAALWQVYLVAVVLGVAAAVFQPTGQAFLTELVETRQVPGAVALSSGSLHAARLVGPALAGLMIVIWDTGPVFLVAAATVGCLIFALSRLDGELLNPAPRGRGGPRAFAEGVRYAFGHPEIRLVLGIMVFVGTFAANAQVTNALMATKEYGLSAGEFGLLGSALAIGSLTGAAFAARRKSVSLRLVAGSAFAFAGCNLVSGLMPGYGWFMVALVPVGIAQLTFMTAANATLQLAAAPQLRGRVLAFFMVALTGSSTFGGPLLGLVAEQWSARTALVSANVVALAGTLLVCLVWAPRPASRDVPGDKAAAEPVVS